MAKRRTQEERRATTKRKILDATIESLAEIGYSRTTTTEISKRSGVSMGAMFNYYPTRLDMILAATQEISDEQVAQVRRLGMALLAPQDVIDQAIALIQEGFRSKEQAAWIQVIVAAPTDEELRARVGEYVSIFHDALSDALREGGLDEEQVSEATVVVLTVLHAFLSEAITHTVMDIPLNEALRARLMAEFLRREFAPFRPVDD